MWSGSSFKNAGISRSSFRLIDGLSSQFPEDQLTVFANSSFEPSENWQSRPNLTVKSVVPPKRGTRAFWESFGAAREVRANDFDVWFSTTHAVPAKSRIPSVAVIHDMIPLLFPQHLDGLQVAYMRFALLHVARKATRVVTNSHQTKSDIVKLAKVDPDKVIVVPFGAGNEFQGVKETSSELEIPFKRYFLVIGTLEPRKNLSRLFEAMSLLSEPEFSDVGLVVAGGRGWKEHGIFETFEKLNLKDRVFFPGYVEDDQLNSLFFNCQAFVFPSLYEGFGMPIVEAMQRGAPILTSGGGAMREVAGDAARYFDPLSPESMAACLKEFLTLDPAAREVLVAEGSKRVNIYNWELAAEQTHQVLMELADAA